MGDGQHHKGHQGHAPDKPPGHLGQEEHQPRENQCPAQGEQPRREVFDPHNAHAPVGKPQGEIQHQIGQEEGDDIEIGPQTGQVPAVQPVPGKTLPEREALLLAGPIFVQSFVCLFHENLLAWASRTRRAGQ